MGITWIWDVCVCMNSGIRPIYIQFEHSVANMRSSYIMTMFWWNSFFLLISFDQNIFLAFCFVNYFTRLLSLRLCLSFNESFFRRVFGYKYSVLHYLLHILITIALVCTVISLMILGSNYLIYKLKYLAKLKKINQIDLDWTK